MECTVNDCESQSNQTEAQNFKKTKLVCEVCNRAYFHKSGLSRHMKDSHPDTHAQTEATHIECNECDSRLVLC